MTDYYCGKWQGFIFQVASHLNRHDRRVGYPEGADKG